MDDPQQVWSKPHDAPASAQPQSSDGNWWYQYPNGQWIWWSAEKNAWVPVEVPRSTPTKWWVYALVIVAALVLIGSFLGAIISQVPEIRDEIERQQDQINVLGL